MTGREIVENLLFILEKRGSVITDLIEAKRLSDIRRYQEKHRMLRELIKKYPRDFNIDSINEDGTISGITHGKTRFRIHIPTKQLPEPFRTKNLENFNLARSTTGDLQTI